MRKGFIETQLVFMEIYNNFEFNIWVAHNFKLQGRKVKNFNS